MSNNLQQGIFFCSFADSRMKSSLKRIKQQALKMGVFDDIYMYSENNLDVDFRKKFQNKLNPQTRGYGYWSWKPQVILQTFEKMKEGDLLLYADTGCHLNNFGTERLKEYFDVVRKNELGILAFQYGLPLKDSNFMILNCFEKQWTKGDVFNFFKVEENSDIYNSGQFWAGSIIFKKNKNSLAFLKKWLSVFENNFHLVDDSPSGYKNSKEFKENRHDQSIFSLLLKTSSLKPVVISASESEHFRWSRLRKFPILAKRDKFKSVFLKLKDELRQFYYDFFNVQYTTTIRVLGGLGNQMFEYAFGRVVSLKNNSRLLLDTGHLNALGNGFRYRFATPRNYDLNLFCINGEVAKQNEIPFYVRNYQGFFGSLLGVFLEKFIKLKVRVGSSFSFQSYFLNVPAPVYLIGLWQSYKYFEGYEDIIKKDFKISVQLSDSIKKLGEKIRQENTLCVHVRRGDFVNNSYHSILPANYYEQALKKILEKENIDHIYVFSDDIGWCKENMQFPTDTFFVGNEFSGERGIGHFWLMQQCKHFIIPNSTFAWWAAWLADYKDKKVVAPKKWFNDDSVSFDDLCPPDWIIIS